MDDARVTAWHPAVPGIAEVLHARFTDHAYPMHSHDNWTLLIVDSGTVRYDLGGEPHATTTTSITLLPPDVSHDGRAATDAGFRKRVAYLDRDVIGNELVGSAVDSPGIADLALHDRVARMHDALATRTDDLEAESRLAFIVERLRRTCAAQRWRGTGSAAQRSLLISASCSMRTSWKGSASRALPECSTATRRTSSERSVRDSVCRRTST